MRSKAEIESRLRREQDILDRIENVKRLIQMEKTLLTCKGVERYIGYRDYVKKDEKAFGDELLQDLRNEIQLQLLSIVALCYGANPDVGEPMPILEWNTNAKFENGEHPADRFRDVFDECLYWNA